MKAEIQAFPLTAHFVPIAGNVVEPNFFRKRLFPPIIRLGALLEFVLQNL